MDSNFSVKITADISDLQSRLKSVEAITEKFKQSMDRAAGAVKNMEQNANRGRMVAFAFGQVIRDVGFFSQSTGLGILAISNNIPILIDQVALAVPALSGMAGALSLVGSLLTAGLTIWAYSSMAAKENKKSIEEWRNSLDDLTETQLRGAQSASEEIVKLDFLYKATTNAANSTKARVSAAKQLQELYPSIFGNYSTEEIMLGKVSSAYNSLKDNILEAAKAQARFDKIVENSNKILDNQERVKQIQIQLNNIEAEVTERVAKNVNALNESYRSKGSEYQVGIDGVKKLIQQHLAENDTYQELNTELQSLNKNTQELNGYNKQLEQSTNGNKKAVDALTQSMAGYNKETGKAKRDSIDLRAVSAGVKSTTGGLQTPITGPAVKQVDIVGPFKGELYELKRALEAMIPTVNDIMMGLMSSISNGFADVIYSFAEGIGQLISGDMSLADFGRSIISSIGKFLSQMGKQMIAFGAATIAYGAALKAIKSGNPAAMIAGGGTLIAAGAALAVIGAAISGLAGGKKGGAGGQSSVEVAGSFGSVRPFAAGGIVSGPTLGLMGEYPGARRNPEVVAPLDKLKSIIGASTAPADTGNLVARISGNDLVILMDRARKNRGNYF